MAKYQVCGVMMCRFDVTVEASSEDEAEEVVETMSYSELAESCSLAPDVEVDDVLEVEVKP